MLTRDKDIFMSGFDVLANTVDFFFSFHTAVYKYAFPFSAMHFIWNDANFVPKPLNNLNVKNLKYGNEILMVK